MLNAANENVLMAVDALWLEREPATRGVVASRTSPQLSMEEVGVLLTMLHLDGYVRTEQTAIDEPWSYVPTERGRAEVQRVVNAADGAGLPKESNRREKRNE